VAPSEVRKKTKLFLSAPQGLNEVPIRFRHFVEAQPGDLSIEPILTLFSFPLDHGGSSWCYR
jgi:hypothetical protein